MRQIRWLAISAVFVSAVAVSGCSKQAGTGDSSTSPGDNDTVSVEGDRQLDGPAGAVHEFLDALRTGNDKKASSMLSALAREKTASLGGNLTPPASDTAQFAIGKVDYVNDDGARVACAWTDIDVDGQSRTDEAIWVLRREEAGWRIVGFAYQVFPGEEPLLLNFEDPEDVFRKLQWAREETRRRMEADGLQAHQGGENQENPIRR